MVNPKPKECRCTTTFGGSTCRYCLKEAALRNERERLSQWLRDHFGEFETKS